MAPANERPVTLRLHHEPNKIYFADKHSDDVAGPYFAGNVYSRDSRGHMNLPPGVIRDE
jgi:hypothetical protein